MPFHRKPSDDLTRLAKFYPTGQALEAYLEPMDAVDAKVLGCWESALGAACSMNLRLAQLDNAQQALLSQALGEAFSTVLNAVALPEEADTPVAQAVFLRHHGISCAPDAPYVVFNASGAKPALFLFPPSLYDGFIYRGLAQALGQDQPVVCFHQAVRHGCLPTDTDRTTCLSYYIKQLKSLQKEGPYRLGGWSLGGVRALDAAEALRASGDQVSALSLLDPFVLIQGRAQAYKNMMDAFALEYSHSASIRYTKLLPFKARRCMLEDFVLHGRPWLRNFSFHKVTAPCLLVTSLDSSTLNDEDVVANMSCVHREHLVTPHFCMLDEPYLKPLARWITQHWVDPVCDSVP